MLFLPPIAAVVAILLALTAVWRNPRSVAHWTFAVGLVLLALETVWTLFLPSLVLTDDLARWRTWQWRWLSLLPGVWLLFSLTYSRGNYREFLRRWWPAIVAAFLLPISLAFGLVGPLFEIIRLDIDPFASILALRFPGYGLQLLWLIGCVLILLNLERTFRSAVGTLRWRIKLVMLGLAVLFGVRIYTSSQTLLYRSLDPTFDLVNAGALLIACVLIGISLVRTRLLAIDLYPSHAVLRHSLTIILVGSYLLIVGVLAKVVEWLGGTTAFPLKAFFVLLALVLLTLALMSDRVRQWTQRFVSRHLHRPSYDYRQVWQTFSERISPNATVPDLAESVVRWISDTFHVLSATVWVVNDQRQRLALEASTAVESNRAELILTDTEFQSLNETMVRRRDPVDLETATDPWVKSLRAAQPVQFAERGGNRLCLPLVHADEWLGLLTLGDRVSGIPYTMEDLDLLRCVAGQVAASLLTLRLGRRLVDARELEAFQTMSAFFVHDLKNTASSLSLMLQNLPKHFDKPDFREDALRSLRACVDRINNQVAQLTRLRTGLELKRQSTDLNGIVRSALQPIESTANGRVTSDLQPVPDLSLDIDQTRSVITNLVLNALDAVELKGDVRVKTRQQNGCVQLTVTDTGCGMDPEFVRRSLFRPFQTTKKKGTGIGLYHCKLIVEAHGGRIEVESQQDKGTEVRVQFKIGRDALPRVPIMGPAAAGPYRASLPAHFPFAFCDIPGHLRPRVQGGPVMVSCRAFDPCPRGLFHLASTRHHLADGMHKRSRALADAGRRDGNARCHLVG
jgi:putative PEP-CTERM system histidine kinase